MATEYFEKDINQSGVVPFRIKNGVLEFCLITSRNSGRWIFPKGFIENGYSPEQSAVKEAFEEAGITGKTYTEINAVYPYKKSGFEYYVRMYAMEVTGIEQTWPESDFRNRKWASYRDTMNLIRDKSLRKLLKLFKRAISDLTIH